MIVVGTETQSLERQRHLTGVPRVALTLNDALIAAGAEHGIRVLRTHTWPETLKSLAPLPPFLESSQVLRRPLVDPEEADLCLFLDVSHVDFPRLFRASMSSIPKVFFIHDALPVLHPDWFPDWAAQGYRLYLRQVLAVADHVVFPSHHVADQVRSLGWPTCARDHVIPLGSHLEARSPRTEVGSPISLLYVSTIEPRKGHDLLLETFDLLLSQGHEVTLTLVGRAGWNVQRGWQVADVVNRIHRHPELGQRLHWHRTATDADVACLATRATHAVLPPIDEGFGLFLEEALSLGLTVIASDIPVFVERSHPRVRLAARTPEAFAAAIIESSDSAPATETEPPVRTMIDVADDWARLISDLT